MADPPKEHLFTVRDPDLGRISFLFYIPECRERKALCRRIREHGGIVVDSPGCYIYQLKPQSIDIDDLNPGLYAQNILYDARWVDDCITFTKLISKKQYIIKDFVGCLKNQQAKAPFSIIECLRMYDTVEVRGGGVKGMSRSFWNKVSGTGFFPGRTYESLLNKWKQTLSKYTRSEYAKIAIRDRIAFSSSHPPIPFVKSASKFGSSSVAHTEEEEEQKEEKKEERRYIKRKNPSDFENQEVFINLGKEGRFGKKDKSAERKNSQKRKGVTGALTQKKSKKEAPDILKKKPLEDEVHSKAENGEDLASSLSLQVSQLSLQALNVIQPKQQRKLKWYEPQIQKKEIQTSSEIIEEKEDLNKSESVESLEGVQEEEQKQNELDIWTPNLDTAEVGERLVTLDRRFQVLNEEEKEPSQDIDLLMRKVVFSEDGERRLVEDDLNVSQLDTSGEIYEHISQMQEQYQDVLKDSQQIYRLIEEFEGNFDEIENALKARKQTIPWSKLEDAVISEAPEDSRMYEVIVEMYGEEAVRARKKELSQI